MIQFSLAEMIFVFVFSVLASILFMLLFMRKPFSIRDPSARLSLLPPKVQLSVAEANLDFLEEFNSRYKELSFEERCLLLQSLFGVDLKLVVGLNHEGKFWLIGALPYDYSEGLGISNGGGYSDG